MVRKRRIGDLGFSLVIFIIAAFVVIINLYPVVYVFSMSVSDPQAAMRGEVLLWPIGLSRKAYDVVFANKEIFRYYLNTLWYTGVGTLTGLITTVLAAYPLSRRRFSLRGVFMKIFTFTMFFSGGMIPTYLVVVNLGLYNSRWAIILPTLTSAYYIIVMRTYFMSLPEELFDSARIDGANEFQILRRIVLPLSKTILAVEGLWFAVAHWNSYFPEMLYLSKNELQPIQLYLRRVVIQSSAEMMQKYDMSALGGGILSMMQVKYAVIIVTILPIIILYPFLQKYFVKGVMIGSLKE